MTMACRSLAVPVDAFAQAVESYAGKSASPPLRLPRGKAAPSLCRRGRGASEQQTPQTLTILVLADQLPHIFAGGAIATRGDLQTRKDLSSHSTDRGHQAGSSRDDIPVLLGHARNVGGLAKFGKACPRNTRIVRRRDCAATVEIATRPGAVIRLWSRPTCTTRPMSTCCGTRCGACWGVRAASRMRAASRRQPQPASTYARSRVHSRDRVTGQAASGWFPCVRPFRSSTRRRPWKDFAPSSLESACRQAPP